VSYSSLETAGIVYAVAEAETKDLATVEERVLDEIRRIQTEGVSEEERQLAVVRVESQHAFDTETAEGLAFAYGIAETMWTLDAELRYIDSLRAVTREQIQEAARRWLPLDRYARLTFTPEGTGGTR
jgi:predicted Zn-dependent peptidase